MSLTITHGFDSDILKRVEDQIPFATMLALNDVAFQSRQGLRQTMKEAFHMPKAFTYNSALYKKATKRELQALVYIRKEAAEYLQAQFEGGDRLPKGLEIGLRARDVFGRSVPPDLYFVPATRLRNKNGNITKGRARTILDETRKRNGRYFLRDNTDGTVDVLEKKSTKKGGVDSLPALIGVRAPRYTKRIDFMDTVQDVVSRTYAKAFERALDRALPKSNY